MAAEEVHHRTMLFDLYRSKFGDYLPLIRRQDVKGFVHHKPLWLVRPLGLDEVRKYAEAKTSSVATDRYRACRAVRPAENPRSPAPLSGWTCEPPISSDSSRDNMAGTGTRIRIHRSTRADTRADVPCD